MKRKLILCLALVLSGGLLIAQSTNSLAVKITFTKPFVASQHSLPREALTQPGWGPKEHGAFTNIVAGRISALNVTWADSKYFKTENQMQIFLNELLNSSTQTWNYHVWSWMDSEPMLIATVEHKTGKQGKLFVWFYPNIYWAYLDENGKWWWSMSEVLKITKS
jgi:hypothetical protein